MNCWAIVPVKPLVQAKSRLAGVLSGPERARLMLALFRRTVDVLVAVEALSRVLVVSADPIIGKWARIGGADFLLESDAPGLNCSLGRAIRFTVNAGAEGVLIVPGDLPQLNGASVAALLAAVGQPPAVGIVPDHHHTGTNGLLLIPPTVIQPAFGPDSLARHCAAAEAVKAQRILWEDSLWGQDVDFPEDLGLVEPDLWQNKSSLD